MSKNIDVTVLLKLKPYENFEVWEALQMLMEGNAIITSEGKPFIVPVKWKSGHKLVPVIPTKEMVYAGNVAMNPLRAQGNHPETSRKRAKCYTAMVNAFKEKGDE